MPTPTWWCNDRRGNGFQFRPCYWENHGDIQRPHLFGRWWKDGDGGGGFLRPKNLGEPFDGIYIILGVIFTPLSCLPCSVFTMAFLSRIFENCRIRSLGQHKINEDRKSEEEASNHAVCFLKTKEFCWLMVKICLMMLI